MIATLLNAKAPIVGIPVEGSRPLAFKRKVVVESLKGLKVEHEQIIGEFLIVRASAPGVKAIRKFQGRWMNLLDIRKQINGWAAGERARRAKRAMLPADKKLAAKVSKVKALWAKLERLTPKVRVPFHVRNANRYEWERDSILAWYRRKAERRRLGKGNDWNRPTKPYCLRTDDSWNAPKWGRDHFPRLDDEDRRAVKAQLACVLGIDESEVSVYRRRDLYEVTL